MPFSLPFLTKRQPKLTTNMSVGITETGKRVVIKGLVGGHTFAILSRLDEHSPRTVGELSEDTQIDIYEVKERLRQLAHQGYVKVSGDIEI